MSAKVMEYSREAYDSAQHTRSLYDGTVLNRLADAQAQIAYPTRHARFPTPRKIRDCTGKGGTT
jgi:hypothetical protein